MKEALQSSDSRLPKVVEALEGGASMNGEAKKLGYNAPQLRRILKDFLGEYDYVKLLKKHSERNASNKGKALTERTTEPVPQITGPETAAPRAHSAKPLSVDHRQRPQRVSSIEGYGVLWTATVSHSRETAHHMLSDNVVAPSPVSGRHREDSRYCGHVCSRAGPESLWGETSGVLGPVEGARAHVHPFLYEECHSAV